MVRQPLQGLEGDGRLHEEARFHMHAEGNQPVGTRHARQERRGVALQLPHGPCQRAGEAGQGRQLYRFEPQGNQVMALSNGVEFKRRIKVRGADDTPTLRGKHTLTTGQLVTSLISKVTVSPGSISTAGLW